MFRFKTLFLLSLPLVILAGPSRVRVRAKIDGDAVIKVKISETETMALPCKQGGKTKSKWTVAKKHQSSRGPNGKKQPKGSTKMPKHFKSKAKSTGEAPKAKSSKPKVQSRNARV